MAEEHKVPKGVLESATMKYGITLDQFFILSFVSVVLTFVIFSAENIRYMYSSSQQW